MVECSGSDGGVSEPLVLCQLYYVNLSTERTLRTPSLCYFHSKTNKPSSNTTRATTELIFESMSDRAVKMEIDSPKKHPAVLRSSHVIHRSALELRVYDSAKLGKKPLVRTKYSHCHQTATSVNFLQTTWETNTGTKRNFQATSRANVTRLR